MRASGSVDASYTARHIEVLEGLEPVRRRPGMYIGGTDERALHHLAAEVLDNAMDEAVAGHASFIEVELEESDYLSVSDNGRGIPVDPHPRFPGKSALEVIMTTLHSGGKFEGKAYSTSGGLHGVGVSVVNALSTETVIEVAREKKLYRQAFAKGVATSKLEEVGAAPNRRGTSVTFTPDAVVHHRSSATSDLLGLYNRGFLFERNAFLTAYKNYEPGLWERIFPAVMLTFLARAETLLIDRKAAPTHLAPLVEMLIAMVILLIPGGEAVFDFATKAVKKLLEFTDQGSNFIFESFVTQKWEPALINFAFAVLPTIIFFSSLMTILYHLGVMQKIVYVFALVMQKTMRISGAESLSAAANIFVGQTEAPLVIKPYVDRMTVSELMTVMVGGFATVAGGVMAIYVGMLEPLFPDIAGHLIAASVMSAPAALVIAKIMYPETEVPETAGELKMTDEKEDVNVLDAASRGAAEGLTLALNVGAMLLAFIALIGLVNFLIGWPFELIVSVGLMEPLAEPMTLQRIMGYVFAPIAFIMGVPWDDCLLIGRLLGVKMVVNELVAYAELQTMLSDATIHLQDRSVIIATYALCGFANFGSIGIQLGGIGGIAPSRKHDLAKIAFKAMLGGTIAAFMTATIAGILV